MLSPARVTAIQALQREQLAMKLPVYTPPRDTSVAVKRDRIAETMTASLRLLSSKVAAATTLEGGSRISFLAWDRTRRGYLLPLDLAAVLGSYGVYLNQEELAHLFERMDADGDGRVEYDDFAKTMASVPPSDKAERGSVGVLERRAIVALPVSMTVAGDISRGGAARAGAQLKASWVVDCPRNAIAHIREHLRLKYPSNEQGQLVRAFLKYQVVLPDTPMAVTFNSTTGHVSGRPMPSQQGNSLRLAPPLKSCGSARRLVGPAAVNWTHGVEYPSGFRSDLVEDSGSSCGPTNASTEARPSKTPYLTVAALLKGLQMDHAAPERLTLRRLWQLVLPYSADAAKHADALSSSAVVASAATRVSHYEAPAGPSASTTISLVDGGYGSPLNATTNTSTIRSGGSASSAATRTLSPAVAALGNTSSTFTSTGTTSSGRAFSVVSYQSPLPITAPAAVPSATATADGVALPPGHALDVTFRTSPLASSSVSLSLAGDNDFALASLALRVGLRQDEFASFATGSFDQARGIAFSDQPWADHMP